MRVTGTDRFGQTITRETSVEISDIEDANKLRLFAAAASLKVGQDAKVRLHSRLDKGLALLTYEGETILCYQIVELHKDYNDLAFKVGHDLFLNFRLAVAAIDGRDLRASSKEFTVERALKVAVKPLKEAFLPGEDGQIEITVTDQTGQPVAAELSLALVNEALFAVCPDATTLILDFFQKEARRHADFHTGATCGFRYAGTTRPVAKALTDEAGRLARDKDERKAIEIVKEEIGRSFSSSSVHAGGPQPAPEPMGAMAGGGGASPSGGRVGADKLGEISNLEKDLPDGQKGMNGAQADKPASDGKPQPRREVRGEGRWLPSVIAGADGKAVATVRMPETTTAWRLTARGCSVETLVGQATAATLTRKDFFVELKTPSFLREGDEIRVVGRIHNLTDFAGTVPLTLRVLDAKDKSKVLATREKSIEVKAKGGAEVAFDAFVIPNTLNVTFELAASAGEQKDSLEQTLPVQPWGLPYVAHAGGTANSDTAAVLRLPEGRTYARPG